jgi:polysaccharide export outer membrane protein
VNRRIFLWGILSACLFTTVWSQVPSTANVLEQLGTQRALQALLARETGADPVRPLPMEGTIDVNRYIVGPSDMMSIGLWGGPITNIFALQVTPEGTLIVPSVGEIKVDQMKLADVKKEVAKFVKSKFPSTSSVTVTLTRTRSFLVSLRGSVLRSGQYTATPLDRLEKILAQGAEAEYASPTMGIPGMTTLDGEPVVTKMESFSAPALKRRLRFDPETSTRNILLIRRNGDTLKVDLPKYYVTGDEKFNPFLMDGDVIQVPKRDISQNFVSVLGSVNIPGDYEYAESDNLFDLIAVAGGLSLVADENQVVLSRVDGMGNLVSERTYSMSELRSGKAENPRVERGDRIFVKSRPTIRKRYEVVIEGEVQNPGSYPISAGKTTLSTVIQQAGGCTDRALLEGAYVLRSDDRLKDVLDPRVELVRALRTHQLGLLDSLLYLVQLKVGREPVVVNLKKLLVDHDSTQDVVLQKNDIIYIPSDFDAVVVQGQVAHSGYITFVPGKDLQYYIGQAGGFTELADSKETRIIKRGSLEWVEPGSTTIESGDQIWVPKQTKKDFLYYFTWAKEGAGLVSSIFSVAYLIIAVKVLTK